MRLRMRMRMRKLLLLIYEVVICYIPYYQQPAKEHNPISVLYENGEIIVKEIRIQLLKYFQLDQCHSSDI